jgi:hypothetical protein
MMAGKESVMKEPFIGLGFVFLLLFFGLFWLAMAWALSQLFPYTRKINDKIDELLGPAAFVFWLLRGLLKLIPGIGHWLVRLLEVHETLLIVYWLMILLAILCLIPALVGLLENTVGVYR